jgi:hypothetical protein
LQTRMRESRIVDPQCFEMVHGSCAGTNREGGWEKLVGKKTERGYCG